MKKIIATLLFAAISVFPALARSVTLTLPDGSSWTYDLPDDVANIVDQYKSEIERHLAENNVTKEQLDTAAREVDRAYSSISSSLGTDQPYTVAKTGLNEFADVIRDSLPNSQAQQNVWANAWIGYLVQIGNGKVKPNFGLGLNAGAAKLDLSSIKKTMDAFKIDYGSLPGTLAMPTLTFDARLGGIKVGGFSLPIDIGFTISAFDSSKVGLESTLKPVAFDYFAIGGDIRYCLFKLPVFETRLSVGAGYYYTKGGIHIAADQANAGLDFKSSNFMLTAQASAKFAFFRPFVAGRFMFANTSVDWYAKDINWKSILSDSSSGIADAVLYGLLPSKFSDTVDGFKFHPVIQGGFAFDIVVVDLTFSASYDFASQIYGGAFSIRFSL